MIVCPIWHHKTNHVSAKKNPKVNNISFTKYLKWKNVFVSVLLTDLDQDGSHELISFSTTYLNYKDRILPSKETWKLVSKVRLIRLESELPKLYEPLV